MVPDENKEDQEDTEGVLYKMISRNKWESVFTDKIPRKYSNIHKQTNTVIVIKILVLSLFSLKGGLL